MFLVRGQDKNETYLKEMDLMIIILGVEDVSS